MDVEKTNRWLALLANIGVIIGIVFLAIEVSQNSDVLRQGSALSTSQGVLEANSIMDSSYRLLAQDPVLAQLVSDGHSAPEDLTDLEWKQFSHWLRADINAAEAIWFYYARGLIPEQDFSGYRNSFCSRIATKGGQRWWSESSQFFADGFSSQIDDWCFR